jgi:trimethylamine---corrinoid protein Co-methyltransferase
LRRAMRGIEVTDGTTDLSVFKQVGPGADFVGTQHTRENFRREMFVPSIMDRGYLALHKDPRAKAMRNRAKEFYRKMMGQYQAPELPKDIEAKLDRIIEE